MFRPLLGGSGSLVPLPHGVTLFNSYREPRPGLPSDKLKSFGHVGYPGLSSPRKMSIFFLIVYWDEHTQRPSQGHMVKLGLQ